MTELPEDQGALPQQPAGWYPSPSHLPTRKTERFWNGTRWSDELRVKGRETTIDGYRSRLRLWRVSWALIAVLGWALWIFCAYLNFSFWVILGLFILAAVNSFVAFFGYISTKQKLKELRSAGMVNAFLSGQNLTAADQDGTHG